MEEQWRGHGNEDEEVEEGEDETSYPAALEPSFDGEDGGSTPYANSNGYYHEAYGKLEVLKPQERIPIRNWNEEFQSVLGGIARCGDAGKLDHYNKLSSLAHDFVYVAKTYGKIIILERFLPSGQKTIKPVDIGGTAGGEKYICQGILFKFAVDTVGIYSGDEYSSKAAGHELKGLMGYYQCQIEGVHVPLCTLIDYRGFRLIAMSILPLYYGGLVYGSNDGGLSIHADDPLMNHMMKRAAKKLNIKGHVAGRSTDKKFIYGPTDIEGHKGQDDRYYLLDFARVYPPEAMPEGSPKASYLYCLLRPEFVKRNPVPLSSDAFSRFGQHHKDVHEREVVEATQRLHRKVIPRFAAWLDSQDERRLKGLKLTQLMHREGINNRHLGRIRFLVSSAPVKQLLLNEMLSRAIKCSLRLMLRRKMEETTLPSEEPYRRELIDYFNLVLGKRPESDHFWKVEIKRVLGRKFVNGLSTDEAAADYNLKRDVSMLTVFTRLQTIMGVRLAVKALQQLAMSPDSLELVYPDLLKISAKAKHMDIISHAEGAALCIQAMNTKGEESDRLFNLAMAKFDTALSSMPDNQLILKNWGDGLCEQMKTKAGEERDRLVWKAIDKYQQMRCTLSLTKLGELLHRLASDQTAEERARLYLLAAATYSAATELRPDLWQAFYSWGDILYEQARAKAGEEAEKLYQLSGDKYARAFALNPGLHIHHPPPPHGTPDGAAPPATSAPTPSAPSSTATATTATAGKEAGDPSHQQQQQRGGGGHGQGSQDDDDETDRRVDGNPHLKYDVYYAAFEDEDEETSLSLSMTSLSSLLLTSSSPSLASHLRRSPSPPPPQAGLPGPTFSLSTPPSPTRRSPPVSPIRGSLVDPTRGTGDSSFAPASLFAPSPDLPSLSSWSTGSCGSGLPLLPFTTTTTTSSPYASPTKRAPATATATRPPSPLPPWSSAPPSAPTTTTTTSYSPTAGAARTSPVAALFRDDPRSSPDTSASFSSAFSSSSSSPFSSPHSPLSPLSSCSSTSSSSPSSPLSPSSTPSSPYSPPSLLSPLSRSPASPLSPYSSSSSSSLLSSSPFLSPRGADGSGAAMEGRDLALLVKIAQRCPTFEEVDAAWTNQQLSNSALSFIALHHGPRLVTLKLAGCHGLTSEAFPAGTGGGGGAGQPRRPLFPSLKHLDLSGSSVTDETLVHLLHQCPSLQLLDLRGCGLIGVAASARTFANIPALASVRHLDLADCRKLSHEVMVQVLPRCSSLRSLSLALCTNVTTAVLAQVAAQCTPLESVDLSGCRIEDDSLLALAKCSRLKSIKLNACANITNKALMAVAARWPALQTCSLVGCEKLTDAAVSSLAKHCPSLALLDLSRCKNVSNASVMQVAERCPALQSLGLDQCQSISDEAILSLSKRCGNLQAILLGGTYKITDDALAQVIARAGAKLQVVNLAGCEKLTSASVMAIAHHCPNLRVFNMSDCNNVSNEALIHVLRSCPSLVKLNLARCKQLKSEVLVAAAQNCPELQQLVLSWCPRVSAPAIVQLVRSCPALRVLDLSECKQITDDALLKIAHSCPYLELLNVANATKITDMSIVGVAQCCVNLKALILSGCWKVTDAGMMKIARHCTALQIVRLGRCYKVTDASVMKVAAHCPLLQTISLNGCRQISDTSVLHLARSCKHLKQLGIDSTNQVSRHVLMEIKKTFPNLATKTRP